MTDDDLHCFDPVKNIENKFKKKLKNRKIKKFSNSIQKERNETEKK